MAQLDGKVAFVTGAGSGLGREITLTFARAGARVAVADLRPVAAAAVDAELRALGAALACGPLAGDVADAAAVRGWFERLGDATGGRLDILVNNAGHADTDAETQARLARQVEELMAGGRPTTPLEATARLTDERWHRMLAVHLTGTFFCTRAALPLMVAAGGGRIINMASIAGTTGIAGATHYSAAKGGIIAFTRKLAFELGPYGININAIAPSRTLTERIRPRWNQSSPEDQQAEIDRTPLRRVAEADDQAKVICFLASSDADFVTGVTIDVTGGN